MAIKLSATAELLLQQRNIIPNIIVEIDGVPFIYGALDIDKIARFDEDGIYFDMPGLVFDGNVVDENSRDYISLGGTGTTLSQQLLQDKGSAQSITTFNLELIDKNQEITRLITPGIILDEIIGVKARCYLNFKGGAHPEDSILFHRGIISKVQSQPASISLTIASPERQKRQKVFVQGKAILSGNIDSSVTTIPVVSTEQFLMPADSGTLRTFFKINDEIIEYTGLTSTTFTGCIRGTLSTTAVSHALNDEASSIYRLEENCINLALKLMHSGGPLVYATDPVKQFNWISPTESRRGTIIVNYYDIADKRGVVVGDKINVINSGAGNNVTGLTITNFDHNEYGSWIEVDHTFNDEFTSPASVEFISKYNVLSDGLGMTNEDIDTSRHEELRTRFFSNLAEYIFYIKDTINGDEFLPQQVYYPSGFYSLPRKSKSSIGVTVPPIANDDVVFLDETNVVKPSQIKPERSIDNYFYNAIVYKYEKDAISDKFLRGKINYSADSQNRIKNVGNKVMTVSSDGLRDQGSIETLIRINSRRALERFQFASEKLPGITVFSKAGYSMEVGDVVVFGSPELQISDITRGDREFTPKLYEAINKSLNVKTGEIKVDLLATNFALDRRYGIISPSSYIGAGSTTSRIKVIDSFSTSAPNKEKAKWRDYIGETIFVHSTDYSFGENTTLISFDPTDDYAMQVDPPLSFAPASGYIVDAPNYDLGLDPAIQSKWKLINVFFDPQVKVASGSNSFIFDVGPSDIGKFHVGSIIRVHNFSYSIDSPDSTIVDITGNTITVDISLGFTPSAGQLIDLIGFNDLGLAYAYI